MIDEVSPQVSKSELLIACETFQNIEVDPLCFVSNPQPGGSYAGPLSYLADIRDFIATSFTTLEALFDHLGQWELSAVYTGARIVEQACRHRQDIALSELDVEPESFKLILGDVTIKGALSNGGIAIIIGSLTVHEYSDYDDMPYLVVLGDIQCGSAWIGGGAAVAGHLHATRLLYGSGHDSCIFIGGHTRSEVIILDDKSLVCRTIDAEATVDSRVFDVAALDHWHELRRRFASDLLPTLPQDEDDDDAWGALEELDSVLNMKRVAERVANDESLLI